MGTTWRWTKRLLIFLVALAVVLSGLVVFTVRRSFPQTDGSVTIEGLDGTTSVVRDASGVPHIYATTEHDLYLAQGYVLAQERFFQMDFWRHIGAARLSEMFGESTVETDRFLRAMRFAPTAEAEFAALPAEYQATLEAYADGVNRYLESRSGAELSLEYAILGLTNRSYRPEPWTPADTLTWAKMMSWDLGSNMDQELSRALAAGSLDVEQVDELWPPYPDDQPVIVRTGGAPVTQVVPTWELPTDPTLAALSRQVQEVRRVTGESGAEIGSNNWVVAGERTSTGAPILANDPHLSIQMPSIWFQVGLHCVGEVNGCSNDVVGFSFAGTPGVVIGHNDRIAWGVTNMAPDTQDLVIEKLNPANPNQYEVNGTWVDMDVSTEQIAVAGGASETLEIRWTRNGPLLSGFEDFATDAGAVTIPEDSALALRWTSLGPSTLVEAILDLNHAQNWDEFRNALSKWDIAAQNMVYADVDGNIGYQSTGSIPVRAEGDGRWPVPGWTDQYAWVDTIPFEELPFSFNPPSGYIVTANNAVVDDGYPYVITADWAYGYRAKRIAEVLAQNDTVTVAFMNELQADSRNVNAAELMPFLLDVPSDTPAISSLQETLRGWSDQGDSVFDASFQNRVDSGGAAAYNAIWRSLLLRLLDELDPDMVPIDGRDRMFVVINQLVQEPGNALWDLIGTGATERRDDILALAMEDAYTDLVDRFGDDPSSWRWGELHTVEFRNGTLGESGIAPIEALFNRGPFEVDGGTSIVNAMSWSPVDGFEVVAIPSMRMVIDMADFDASTSIHSTGQSGHAFHSRYTDMVEAWATGETLPMRWSEDIVRANSDGVLILNP